MSANLPLNGKNVLVPRGKKEAKSFSDLVQGYGGVPVEIPLISFRPIDHTKTILQTISNLHTYDWIIFTSNVTVETFFSFVKNINVLSSVKVAAIGEKTEQALLEKGIAADFVPEEYVAEKFVEKFLPLVESGIKILIPKGNLAREYIARSLTGKGALVDELIVYETYFPEESKAKLLEMISNRELHILTFTSPSTVTHFMNVINEYSLLDCIGECVIACIGPVTKERALAAGLSVHVMPKRYTVKYMIEDVISYLLKS